MSQSISTSLQIGAVFEIFSLSLVGIVLPFVIIYYRNTSKRVEQNPAAAQQEKMEDIQGNIFKTMKAVSVGVMLGLAMMHLFPDADENLSAIYPDYPLANVLVCFGIILVLSIEQIATTFWRKLHPTQQLVIKNNIASSHDANKAVSNISSLPDHGHDHNHGHPNENSELGAHSSSASTGVVGVVVPLHNNHSHDHDHESHNENCGFMTCQHDAAAASVGNKGTKKIASDEQVLGIAALALIQEEESFKDIVAAYIMEFSIAAHSIIIGVNLGLLGEDDVSSIVALMIALGFHQAVEGFGLGTQIAASYYSGSEAAGGQVVGLDQRKVLLFIVAFVCSTPLGVMIGMLSQSQEEESDAQLVARGAAEAIGTGSLLYVALVEMLPDLFHRPHGSPLAVVGLDHHHHQCSTSKDRGMGPTKTVVQIMSISLGVAFMALLAVWA